MAALAVLWSVFRLYDLLKPSALTSEEEYAERQSLLSTTWTKETDRQLRGCLRQFSLMFNMLNRGIGAVWLLVSTCQDPLVILILWTMSLRELLVASHQFCLNNSVWIPN